MVSANNLNILHNIYPCKASANTIQRCGRISRTFPNKEKAIVYDYIYDHPIFFYQFYNLKKVCRLKAYFECTNLPEYMEDLINFIQSRIKNKSINKNKISRLIPVFNEVVVRLN